MKAKSILTDVVRVLRWLAVPVLAATLICLRIEQRRTRDAEKGLTDCEAHKLGVEPEAVEMLDKWEIQVNGGMITIRTRTCQNFVELSPSSAIRIARELERYADGGNND
jgi:hypothetical protein